MKTLALFVTESNGVRKHKLNMKIAKRVLANVNFKWLMQNKKGKKQQNIKESAQFNFNGSQYIDCNELAKDLDNLYTEVVDKWDSKYKDIFYDQIEEWTYHVIESICNNMDKYVHASDHHMNGNFCNIELDYENSHKGKNFEDIIKKIDSGAEDDETQAYRKWALDWFFEAFGTWGLKYNFETYLSEEEYQYEQEDKNDD